MAANSSRYFNLVSRGSTRVEIVLKFLLTPAVPPEGLIESYLILFNDNNPVTFQKLIDLKGLRRQEQQSLYDMFIAHVNPQAGSSTASSAAGAWPKPVQKINENIRKLVLNLKR